MKCEGTEFSPHLHNAVLKEKTKKFKPGRIIKVIDNGYYYGDVVLKPATVVVAEKKEDAKEEEASINDTEKDIKE